MAEIHRLSVGASGRLMVSVYLRKHKQGSCYYARFKISNSRSANGQRYITESLQTDDIHYAFERARTRYAEINFIESQNQSLKTESVALEIDRFVAEYKEGVSKNLGSHSKNTLRLYNRGLAKYWKEFLGSKPLISITSEHLAGYELWRQGNKERAKLKQNSQKKKLHGNTKDKVSNVTIEAEINQFKVFLRWATSKGKYSGSGLAFVYKNLAGDNKRSAFTAKQWTTLTGYMRRKAWTEVGRRGNDSRLIRHRHMLKAYVLFMKNTGLRVGEARNLRWSDVEFVHANDEAKRLVRVSILKAHSKVKKSSIVIGNEGAYNALWSWYSYRKEHDDFCESDHLVWCDVDGRLINEFREGFNNLIAGAGVSLDSAGNKLTIYSLRHTYITEQLRSGVAIYTIASNCNTSVAMIERYYSDARPKDFEEALTAGYRKSAVGNSTKIASESAKPVAKKATEASKKRSKPVLTGSQ